MNGQARAGFAIAARAERKLRAVGAFIREHAFPIGLFLVLRLWTGVWASVSALFVLPSAEAARRYYDVEPLRDAVFAPWQRWDTIWYLKLAQEGYAADARAVFAPLYPLFMRVLRPIFFEHTLGAGLFVSSAAALASFILLYRLAREIEGEAAARRTLLFLGAFPTAFFLFAAYPEALFLAFALGAFWCARGKSWGWAGVWGGLGALTRPQGALFVLPLAVEFWSQWRRKETAPERAWSLGLVVLGGAAHFLWLAFQLGSPAVWFQAQAIWHRLALPWDALGAAWGAVIFAPMLLDAAVSWMDPFFAVVFLAALGWSWQRLPLSYTTFMAVIVLPPLFVVTTYSLHYPLTAMARYVLVAFPFFLLMGSLPKGWWQPPVLALSFLTQTVWLMLFVAWVFVR